MGYERRFDAKEHGDNGIDGFGHSPFSKAAWDDTEHLTGGHGDSKVFLDAERAIGTHADQDTDCAALEARGGVAKEPDLNSAL